MSFADEDEDDGPASLPVFFGVFGGHNPMADTGE
jgi:hypothetical protein